MGCGIMKRRHKSKINKHARKAVAAGRRKTNKRANKRVKMRLGLWSKGK